MKAWIFILAITLTIPLISIGQTKDEIKERKKKNKETPPGTVWLRDSLYFDQTEVRNVDYREYLFWTKRVNGDTSEIYKNALPDTLVWRSKLAFNEPYVELYLNHSAYKDYPVVGISYEQAIDYCNWRSDRVNEWYLIKNKLITLNDTKTVKLSTIDSLIKIHGKYKYRLPTKEEWEFAAYGGLNLTTFPWGNRTMMNCKLGYLANFRQIGEQNIIYNDTTKKYEGINISHDNFGLLNDQADVTAPATSYWTNGYGLYCMSGNVAELVAEKGITKGGSWARPGYYCRIKVDDKYNGPTNDIGFRCICEMIK